MKKSIYLIILLLILGLVFTGCLLSNVGQVPISPQSGITYLTKALPLHNNLVGLWHFSGNALDSSGNGNYGTLQGDATFTFATGKFGQALSLDGTSDYVEVADSPSLDVTGELTIEAWVRANVTISGTTQMQIVDKGEHTSSSGYMLMIYNGDLYGRVNKAGITATIYGPYPDDGEWHHVAYTFKSGEQKLYIDWSEVKSNTGTATIITNNYPLLIGMGVNRPQYSWNGLIDEVRIWNVALLPDQLGFIYDFGGILSPIKEDGSSVFKLGRTIPVKFQLWDDQSNFVTDAVANIFVKKISNGTSGEVAAVSTAAATTGNLFRYDPDSEQYIFNLSTKLPLNGVSWSTGTWEIRIELDDGMSYYVEIGLK
jgi:hypothetical protein